MVKTDFEKLIDELMKAETLLAELKDAVYRAWRDQEALAVDEEARRLAPEVERLTDNKDWSDPCPPGMECPSCLARRADTDKETPDE